MESSLVRVTVTLDSKTLDVITQFAKLSGVSRSALLRSLLAEVAPQLSKAVDLYQAAQSAGEQSKAIIGQSVRQMEAVVPQQQAFLRSWNELLAATQEQLEGRER